MKSYDYLIVGSGLFGAVFAHELTKAGKKCLVIDKRSHSGGNVYCKQIEGIQVHQYGAHIFHTSDKGLWDYVNSFVEFNDFINSPLAKYKEESYNLPFNMNTFKQMWGVETAEEARAVIEQQVRDAGIHNPQNLEEKAISMVGTELFEKLIKGYTEKQWGIKASLLPASIITRIPVRFEFNNNYFNDLYQGIPKGGYNKLIEGLLKNIEVKLNIDYLENEEEWNAMADKIVYTGKLDELFKYELGVLAYRSLKFDHQILNTKNFQNNAVVNYTDIAVPYTRILEHKHFEFGTQEKTVVTYEYPMPWEKGADPYYPINDDTNNLLYNKYKALANSRPNLIIGGRLAEYKYYDMHQVIASALTKVKKCLSQA
jgi:UDP-galactopyranose mutase